ncbi:hypothetical protein PybrP1_013038 [[Pythium] brassicae (nom. inval.)]|nr:hypothetical protein PybrP1_013038 [[Pythium] brassicae (nom. inval.)]
MDVPGVIEDRLLLGSVAHARDAELLTQHLRVSFLLDAENPRKRSAAGGGAVATVAIAGDRVELDDDVSYDAFRLTVMRANSLVGSALRDGKTVFVFCTHGNNESAVVCITYLMLSREWTLERAYKHVLQRRPASAPRKAYVEKLRLLELEVHGRVTLRSEQVGPSMIDIMMGLRGQATSGYDSDERGSHLTESGETGSDRASLASNMSVATGLHNGSSLRETMIIAEQEEELETSGTARDDGHTAQSLTDRRGRAKSTRSSCVIS